MLSNPIRKEARLFLEPRELYSKQEHYKVSRTHLEDLLNHTWSLAFIYVKVLELEKRFTCLFWFGREKSQSLAVGTHGLGGKREKFLELWIWFG